MDRRGFFRAAGALSSVTVLGACSGDGGEAAKPTGTAKLVTGNPGAVYATYGEGLAKLLKERTGADVEVIPTDGSTENLRMLGRPGSADIGFSLADSASDAFKGLGGFASGRIPLTALARIYENYVHVCVLRDSKITKLGDLRGRKVNLGAPQSGTLVIAQRILGAAGVKVRPEYQNLMAAARGLEEQTIDALFWSGGLPTAPLTRLQQTVGFRLIDIRDSATVLVRNRSEDYVLTSVPPSIYGTADTVTTLSVPNYLLAREGLPDEWAWWTVDTLFRRQNDLIKVHPEAGSLDERSAIATMPIPLHRAAIRWYRDNHM